MKKILLLTLFGFISFAAKAQENRSVLFTHQYTSPHARRLTIAEMDRMHNAYLSRHAINTAAKTTWLINSDWYDLWNQNYTSGVAAGYSYACFPDSNVVDNSPGVIPYNISTHGLGISFDPTDSSFYSDIVNSGALQVSVSAPMVPIGQIYTVDSFYAPVKYVQNDLTVVDSIIVEIAVATNTTIPLADTGAYNLKFAYTAADTVVSFDGTPRFASVHYNSGEGTHGGAAWENHSTPYDAAPYINDAWFDSVFVVKQRFALAITSADTDAYGNLNLGMLEGTHSNGITTTAVTPITNLYSLPLTTTTLNWRQHMVSFVSFKSGHAGGTYPLGTTAANWINLIAGSPLGPTTWFKQSTSNPAITYPGSYQASLIAENKIRYCDTLFTYPYGRHDILMPACVFAKPDLVVVDQAFHITWPQGERISGVQEISNIHAYPNPSTNELNITYTSSSTSEATVSLINIIGQVVATQPVNNDKAVFNVSALPGGVYIYCIESGGEVKKGRILVVH
jgi:Secretion system C-terminal sorting domain